MPAVRIQPGLSIPEEELEFRFSRSGGPGGQHANTSDTRVELRFALDASTALTDEEKARVRARLGNRITAGGCLVVTGSEHRSQVRNREAVVTRFAAILAEALRIERTRKRTRRSRAADRRRREEKRHKSAKKALRKAPDLR